MQVKDANVQTLGVTYVNYLGQPVDTTPVKVKREKKEAEPQHNGWAAVGIPSAALDAAKREARREEREFDEAMFLRNTPMLRITRKNYSSPGAAQEACALALRHGFVHAEVRELKSE